MNVLLTIRRRGCGCLLAMVVRDGDRLLICGETRQQVWTIEKRWEPRTMEFNHALDESECPIMLGCRDGQFIIDKTASSSAVAVADLIAAARRSTRRGQEYLVG